MLLTTLLVPTFTHLLTSMAGWLRKAEKQGLDEGALFSARLAPDMFPLATQIRFACVQAQEAVYRLRGEAFPESIALLLYEGRSGGNRPGSFSDSQARIKETLTLLGELSIDALDVNPGTLIAHDLPNGMIFDLTEEQYARDWVLAQFYFHVMTAYAILRREGVALGKADYIQHLLPFLRPEIKSQS